ncbi:hypothetical protein XENOCAPTIV_002303, partial [Xenoophorus captivus]
SQAEAHYRGSRHAKKLKSQENKAKAKLSVTPETNGNNCGPAGPTHPISTNCSNSQRTELLSSLTDSLSSLKPCLPSSTSPLSSSPAISRASSEPPPSSPPSGLPAPVLLSTSSSSFSSKSCPRSSVTPSLSGAAPLALQTTSSSSQDAPLSAESEEEKAKKLLYCSLCKVAVNSLSQLEAHNAGTKHKTMLEARSGAGPIKAYPRPGAKLKNGSSSAVKGSGLQNKTFHCQICDVHVNSEIQLKQVGESHKTRVLLVTVASPYPTHMLLFHPCLLPFLYPCVAIAFHFNSLGSKVFMLNYGDKKNPKIAEFFNKILLGYSQDVILLPVWLTVVLITVLGK